MILFDVNVLVDAHRTDSPHHAQVATWVQGVVESGRTMLLADVVLSGFLRVVTNPRIFVRPSPQGEAIAFLEQFLAHPACRVVSGGERHWVVLRRLLVESDARGNVVPDAHLAALALQHGAAVATRDRGFARFAGVTVVAPEADGA